MAKKVKSKVPEFDHLAMIRDSYRWGRWPYLPMKRDNNSLEDKNLGVLVDDGKSLTIYHVYLFGLPATREEFLASPQTTYESHEAMLADGWMVD